MLLSMTGQGAATAFDDNATVTVEIRAVNNRHLKVNLRAPDSLISSESAFEKLIRQNVGRGTVNVSIKLEKTTRKDDFTLDLELIQSYRQQLKIDDGDKVEEVRAAFEAERAKPKKCYTISCNDYAEDLGEGRKLWQANDRLTGAINENAAPFSF